MLALVALWGVPALVRTHGEFLTIGLGYHVVGRSFGTMQGHGGNSIVAALVSLPFYFLTVFISFAPWSVKIPWLARRLWKKRDALDLYLIAGIAVIVVIFTIVKTKLPHYILPAFPLLALLLARHWLESGVRRTDASLLVGLTAAIMLAVALIGFPLIAPLFPFGRPLQESGTLSPARDGFRRLRLRCAEPGLEFSQPGARLPLLQSGGLVTSRPCSQIRFRSFLPAPARTLSSCRVKWRIGFTRRCRAGIGSSTTHGFDIAKGRWVDLTLILKNT